jgi:uncharacterized protein
MTGVELGLLIGSLAAVVGIVLFGWYRSRKGRLPPAMLFILRITLGIIFLILGVIGSLLPVLQGWLFFLIAGLILFPRSRFAVKACDKIEPRMPRLVGWLRRMGIGIQGDVASPSNDAR